MLATAGATTVICVAELTTKLVAGTDPVGVVNSTVTTLDAVKLVPVNTMDVPPVVGPDAGTIVEIVPVAVPVAVLVPVLGWPVYVYELYAVVIPTVVEIPMFTTEVLIPWAGITTRIDVAESTVKLVA